MMLIRKQKSKEFLNSSFKDSWLQIKASFRKKYQNQSNSLQDDQYFEEKPYYQELLTEKNMIFPFQIDYSKYSQVPPGKINIRSTFECFHGILNYIFYYSNNKFNTREIEIHYSGAQSRQNLETILKDPTMNQINQWDILNIFYYEDISSEFRINSCINAFFGISFKKVKVLPLAYAIRSGTFPFLSTHLISFVFEGYDELQMQWDLLDERVNINDLIPNGGYCMFFVHTTKKFYSSFRIRQTEPGSSGFWGFSIAAFEIHGSVSFREGENLQNDSLIVDYQQLDFNDTFSPDIDMTEFIL